MDKEKFNQILEQERNNCGFQNLKGLDLSGLKFEDDYLCYLDLSDANLSNAKLSNSSFHSVLLINANCRNADFSSVRFHTVNLNGANLREADLSGASFINTRLTGTVLDPEKSVPFPTFDECEKAGLRITEKTGRPRVHGWTRCSLDREQLYLRAPVFSVDRESPYHPGLYFAPREYLETRSKNLPIVACWTYLYETVHAGDRWRARRLWIEA